MHWLGILFALCALLGWGFGDFFIQRTTRKVGDVETLLYICFLGMIVIFPFVKNDLRLLANPEHYILLLLTVLVALFASLSEFQAFKIGKLSVIEPIVAIELPVIIGLGIVLYGERINLVQGTLMGLVFIGIVLAVTRSHLHLHYHKRIFEKGVFIAALSAIAMGLSQFLIGVSSQRTTPLLTIWFLQTVTALICLFYLMATGRLSGLIRHVRRYPALVFAESATDNLAWISFTYAVVYISISVASAISEYFIILAIILALIFNRERLKWHQFAGIAFATFGVIALASIS